MYLLLHVAPNGRSVVITTSKAPCMSVCVVLAGGPRDAVAALDADAPRPNTGLHPDPPVASLAARTIDALRESARIARIIAVAPLTAH